MASSSSTQQSKPMCRYFKSGKTCYAHPHCTFYHPTCKFDPQCTMYACQYKHTKVKPPMAPKMATRRLDEKQLGLLKEMYAGLRSESIVPSLGSLRFHERTDILMTPDIKATIGPEKVPCELICDMWGHYQRNMFQCSDYCRDYLYPTLVQRTNELKGITINAFEGTGHYGFMVAFSGTQYGMMVSVHPSVTTGIGKTFLYDMNEKRKDKSIENSDMGYDYNGRIFNTMDELVAELNRVQLFIITNLSTSVNI